MAYKLYLDKAEDFECEVAVKNASLKDAFARIIVEAGDFALMFPGKIKDGKCHVPIKRLKGLLEENSKGKIKLEMVVEDTYFKPWEDNFEVEKHTDIKVNIQEQKLPKKPMVEVKSVKKENAQKMTDVATDIVFICERVGIDKNNIGNRKKDFKQVIKEYFKANPEHIKNSKKFICEAISALK
jgi:hypothetical protein